jgi:hypothetical protein
MSPAGRCMRRASLPRRPALVSPRHGRESGRAVLVHPDSADAPASVLPWRDRSFAAPTPLADGTRRVAVQPGRGSIFQAEPDRAGGCYGKPGAPRAEMFQMCLTDPLADLCRLHLAPQATSTSAVPRRATARFRKSDGAALGGRGQAVEYRGSHHPTWSSEAPAERRLAGNLAEEPGGGSLALAHGAPVILHARPPAARAVSRVPSTAMIVIGALRLVEHLIA